MFGGIELGAVLRHADALDLFEDAEAFEQRHVQGQQGLADVETRMAILFRNDHVPAASGQQRGDGRTSGSATQHENVTVGRFGVCRRHQKESGFATMADFTMLHMRCEGRVTL